MVRFLAGALIAVAATGVVGILKAGLNPETGTYIFQAYSARMYGASSQNWAIAQDRRGIMYFANVEGLLEFDGTSWRKIRLPGRNPAARSVMVDANGTVYLGGVGDFGMLKSDATGSMQFVSLVDKVPEADRSFGDVWRVLSGPGGIYFNTNARLFRLNHDGSVKVWHPVSVFRRAFSALGALYVGTPESGLMRLRADEFEPVPGGEGFATTDVTAFLSSSDHATIATAAHLFDLSGEGVKQMTTAADSFFAKNPANSLLQSPGGEIIVGTKTSGVVFLDPNRGGAIDRIVAKDSGLPDDYVTSLYADRQGGLWVAGYNGIARFTPSLSSFGKEQGLGGDTQTVARHQSSVFVGTTAGLFRLDTSMGANPKFEHIEGISDTVWTLLPRAKTMLASTSHGVFEIDGNKARRILETKVTVWDVASSLQEPNVVYAAGVDVVTKLRFDGSMWKKEGELKASGQQFHSVIEDEDGFVWATTRGGIWKIDFRRDPVSFRRFGPNEMVPPNWINARRLGNHIVFTTEKGLKQYSTSGNRFAPELSLGKEFADGTRKIGNIFEDSKGNVWVTGPGYQIRLRKDGNGFKPEPMPLLRAGIEEIFWMSIDGDGVCWAIRDGKLFRWDPSLNGNPDAGFRVLPRRVAVRDQEVLYGGAGEFSALSLPWRSNALSFEFAAPFYDDPSSVDYRVQLEGSDKKWSAWSHRTDAPYTHLPEGDYTFKIQARTPHGTVSEDSSISFNVAPPWYRTWLAYGVYMIGFGTFVWGAVKWRTRKLVEEKHQLEVIVEERTVEIRQQRDEIHVQERKSQALLLNILPETVADELKATGSVQPVGFEDVTVCFTDFVGFTVSSEKLAPGKLVDSLNEYFTAFDEIIARYGLEKLKTIGDSYMFASGLPTPRKSHAVDAVLAAMEMVAVVKRLAVKPEGTAWGIRVGLHSGPVVAGVVGIRKFAFDIWGNTVNFAARMESSGVPGNVNMSERTQRLLRGLIVTESRGNIKIKEGRELPMYLAKSPICTDPEEFAQLCQKELGEAPRSFPPPATELASVPAAVSA